MHFLQKLHDMNVLGDVVQEGYLAAALGHGLSAVHSQCTGCWLPRINSNNSNNRKK
jgi:hypothetical protein